MQDIIHLIALVLHVLGATVIVGASFGSLIIFAKKEIPRERLLLLGEIWKIAGPAIGLQLITGIILAGLEWDSFSHNPLFWTKMALFVLSGVMGGKTLGEKMKKALASKSSTLTIEGSKRLAWNSFIIYAAIVTIGVLLAELQG